MHANTCSRHLAKDALLSNQYLPVMSESEMGSLNTHTQSEQHTHILNNTLHHPSLDYSLINTHQHRIKALHTDGGGLISALSHVQVAYTVSSNE